MKTKLFKTTFLAIAILIAFTGCEKAVEDLKETIDSGEDDAFVQTAVASAFDVVEDLGTTDARLMKTGNSILPGGANVVFLDSVMDANGVEYYVDFGPLPGLLCNDGKWRAGRINVKLNKKYSEIGAVGVAEILETAPFYAGTETDKTKLTGKLTASRLALNTINMLAENIKAVYKNRTIEATGNYTITRTVGMADPGALGDEYELTGSGSGVNRNGKNYTINITETMLKKIQNGCADTFVKGKIEIKNEGAKKALKIDFDPDNDQACDNKVKITLPNGISQTINL